jgi:hypothetical protein
LRVGNQTNKPKFRWTAKWKINRKRKSKPECKGNTHLSILTAADLGW